METIDDVECPNPNCNRTARSSYNNKTGQTHIWCSCGWDSDNNEYENEEIIDNTVPEKD